MEALRILVSREAVSDLHISTLQGSRLKLTLPPGCRVVKVSLQELSRDGSLVYWTTLRPLGMYLETPNDATYSPESMVKHYSHLGVEIADEEVT